MRAEKAPTKRASKKSAAKKAVTKRAAKKTTAGNASKRATKRPVKRPAKRAATKRVRKKRFSFAKLKQSINSKAAKIIVAISFVSAVFPSLYEWGSDKVSGAVAVAQPVVATYAEDAVKQAVSASPLAKTTAGVWIVDKVGQWTPPSYGEGVSGGAGSPASTSEKVDLVVNPFY